MTLPELPIEILIRVLPFQDYLLWLPNNIIIPWLNLIPQRRLFKLLAKNGLGIREGEMIVTTLSGKSFSIKHGNAEQTTKWWRYFYNKFLAKVFITFGGQIESKHLRNNVIYDFEKIYYLMFEYYHSMPYWFVWSESETNLIPFWKHFCVLNVFPGFYRTTVTYPSNFDDNFQFQSFFNTILYHHDLRITNLLYNTRRYTMSQMKVIEICVTLPQFQNFRNHIKVAGTQYILPYELELYIKLDDFNASYNSYPKNFTATWLIDIFDLCQTSCLCLLYFRPDTLICGLSSLLCMMPHLECLELNFGRLDVVPIPKWIRRFNLAYNLRVKIHKLHYDELKFKIKPDKRNWNACVTEDSVVLDYYALEISPQRGIRKVLKGVMGMVYRVLHA